MITTLVAASLFQNSAPINHEYCGLLLEPQAQQIVMDRQNAGLYQPNASLLGTEQLVITVAWHVLTNGAEVAIEEPTLADMLDAMNDVSDIAKNRKESKELITKVDNGEIPKGWWFQTTPGVLFWLRYIRTQR